MSSACYASNSIIQFNHKGFVICSKDLSTYVSSGTDKKNRTFIQQETDFKVFLILEHQESQGISLEQD